MERGEGEFLTKESDEFGTPDSIWLPLHEEFQFTVDAAASKSNHLLPKYWTKDDSALEKDWSGERVFCNPPYSRGNVKDFFMKALLETRARDCKLAVLLIPTYTERDWFYSNSAEFEVRFIQGRIKFKGGATTARSSHMLIIFRNHRWIW